jgi:hypothetical protein
MRIRIGYDISYSHTEETSIIAILEVHHSRRNDLEKIDFPAMEPNLVLDRFLDGYGNQCCRFVAPAGDLRISCETVIRDSGLPYEVAAHAIQHKVQDLPYDTLGYLLGSRYCETQLLADDAWRLFGHTPPGWARVQAVCDFVHEHLRFDYMLASPTRTAAEAFASAWPSAATSPTWPLPCVAA